jgi:cytochrome c peroxidase
VGSGLVLPNQTLSPDSLHLTRAEKGDLAAFIGALTDTGGYHPASSDRASTARRR